MSVWFAVATLLVGDLRLDELNPPAPEVLVFVVAGAEVETSKVAFFEQARHAIEEHMHARVVSPEEVFVTAGPDFDAKLAECRGDDGCYARLAGPSRARYLFVLTAQRVGGLGVLGSRLIDLKETRPLGNALDPLPEGGKFLAHVPARVEASVPKEMWDPFGVLEIEVNVPGAEVLVNEQVVGVAPIERIGHLVPGEYRVAARSSGYEPATSQTSIRRGSSSRLVLNLAEVSSGSSWILWTAIGAAVVAGSAVAILIATSGSGTIDFCSAPDLESCP